MHSIWEKISGSKKDFSTEHASYNTLSVISLGLLLVLLPFNIAMGLYPISGMIITLIILVAFFYYLSRFRRRFYVSITLYAISSYITLIITYYLNSGLNGPTLYLFFLTFMLLIAFTPRKQHWLWGCLHIIVGTGLVLIEAAYPGFISNSYSSSTDRYFDLVSSFIVTISIIYFTTIFLRNNYDSEKKVSNEKEKAIIEQNTKLEQLNQEKNKLFSIISHDLRSPINSIKGFLQIIGQQSLNADERKYWESELLQQTDRTLEMLSNILSWSKSQMSGKEMRLKSLNLHETLGNTIEVQKAIGTGKGITLHYTPNYNANVAADADMLQLVVRNLISNSIKFTEAGGEINISVAEKGNTCILTIKDNGIGMSESMQEQVFSLNIEPTLGTMNEKGVGLGLALCKEYIELQNGRIWFESIANAGTIFYVALPLVTVAQPSPSLNN